MVLAIQAALAQDNGALDKQTSSYDAGLMRRMGFSEKEIAQSAEREHAARVKHEEAQQEELIKYIRQRAQNNPAYAKAYQLYQQACVLHDQGKDSESENVIGSVNHILVEQRAIDNLNEEVAAAQRRRDEATRIAQQQKQIAAEQAKLRAAAAAHAEETAATTNRRRKEEAKEEAKEESYNDIIEFQRRTNGGRRSIHHITEKSG